MPSDPLFKKAVFLALQKISYRPRSSSEIASHLKEKGFSEEVIKAALEHLGKIGYINDAEFAAYWVEGRTKRKPIGSLALKRELQKKGLKDEFAEKIVEERRSSCDEYEMAKRVALDRMDKMQDVDKKKAKKRLYDYLIRRGFEFDVVYKVLDEVFG